MKEFVNKKAKPEDEEDDLTIEASQTDYDEEILNKAKDIIKEELKKEELKKQTVKSKKEELQKQKDEEKEKLKLQKAKEREERKLQKAKEREEQMKSLKDELYNKIKSEVSDDLRKTVLGQQLHHVKTLRMNINSVAPPIANPHRKGNNLMY